MINQIATGQAAKFLVAVLTAVGAALPVYFGTAKWVPVAIMAIGAATTYLVPNAPAPAPAAQPQPDPPASPPVAGL